MTAIDRRPVRAIACLFAAGVLVGLGQLVSDHDETSTRAGVATANAVHGALAVALATALAVSYRRDRRRLRAFLLRPFTGAGWSAFLAALIAPLLVAAELVLLLAGRTRVIAAAERRRELATLGAAPPTDEQWSVPATARRVLGTAPVRLLQFAAALVMLYMPYRAGQQVFAALDPDFTRDAWGGPGYVGASFAHWLDGVLVFYGCAALIGWTVARPAGVRTGAPGAPSLTADVAEP